MTATLAPGRDGSPKRQSLAHCCWLPVGAPPEDVPRWHTASVHVRGRTRRVGHVERQTDRAEEIARTLLEEPLPRRSAHTQGVATRARTLAPNLGDAADLN